MMWFVFVPLWVVWVVIVFNVVVAIWNAVDDAICERQRRDKCRNPVLQEMQDRLNTLLIPGSADLDGLLKRLAASRK